MNRYLQCSKKYPMPLFSGAWVEHLPEVREEEGSNEGTEEEGLVILAGGGGTGRNGIPNCLLLAQYNFSTTVLSDALHTFSTDNDLPLRMAVHPGGGGVLCSFEEDCRLFAVKRVEGGEVRIASEEREIQLLQSVGEQNSLAFSADGTRLATGAEDGHLRVVEWPSFKVILDQAGAHKSIKGVDFSLDAAFLVSSSDDSGCRIWDLSKGTAVASLQATKGEGYGFARFSRDGTKPLLFVTSRKEGKGFVSTFNTSSWQRVRSRKLQEDPISAFASSRDGRLLAIGSSEGDISIIDSATLSIQQRLKRAHMVFVTAMEFSPDGRALLSVSGDCSARVTAVKAVQGDAWRRYALLLVVFILFLLAVNAVLGPFH